MESKFRVNTNGERSTEEETPATAFRRGEPQPQIQSSSQFQRQRSDEQFVNFHNHDFDLQTLESSLCNLTFTDATVAQNGNPLNHNLYNQPINGGASSARGGSDDRSGGFWFRPPPSACQRLRQRLSYRSDCVNGNGSYDASGSSRNVILNTNGFLNGNSRDLSYPSRNQNALEGINGFGYRTNHSWTINEGFGYNQDLSSSMENERSSLLLWAKDKLLSKQLMERIDESSKERFDMIFNNLIVNACELMVDPYGQDVTLHLMPKCSKEQIILIVDIVTQHQFQFVNLCFDALGTRAIQLLLECVRKVSEDLILRIVGVIHMIALQLARNINGKHVIIHCFKVFKLPQFRNLLEVIAQNCDHIAIDQHGSCLLQHALHIDCAELRRRFIGEIITNALKLCLNSYGNYVVQFIVEMNNPHVIKLLVGQLVGSYGYLSCNKYGSHVVQKLLQTRNVDTRLIVHDLFLDIDTLLLDPFGNYVIQTAWFVSKDDVRHILRWHIENNIPLMRCSKFGKKVLEKLNL